VDALIIKAKSPVVIGTEPRKPKPQRMTIQDLANLILPRLDSLDARMTNVEATLKEQAKFNAVVQNFMDTQAKFNAVVQNFMDTQAKFNAVVQNFMNTHK
jgi:hypothetical protein